ncbi:MAG: ketopantoate reductase C-terminal domain-containing protein, partial [Phycisphaeraceae bacterium]|nr:ketopantoate reductase C-terminal domain-containing protein [Phycisphaeraceae bacterium]
CIESAFLETMFENTDKMVAYKPSMMLDHEAKRPLEIEAIYAAPLAEAAKAGCELPRIRMLYQQLGFCQPGTP